ncbi:MAG: hypothetical protein ACE5JS_07095 [Nitrospinota bacterium]
MGASGLVELEASNTFCFQAATQERAEEIALETARGDAKKLESLGWDVGVKVVGAHERKT